MLPNTTHTSVHALCASGPVCSGGARSRGWGGAIGDFSQISLLVSGESPELHSAPHGHGLAPTVSLHWSVSAGRGLFLWNLTSGRRCLYRHTFLQRELLPGQGHLWLCRPNFLFSILKSISFYIYTLASYKCFKIEKTSKR